MMMIMTIMMMMITVIIKNDDDNNHHDDNDTDDDDDHDDSDDDDRIKMNSLNNRAHLSFHHTNRPLIAFSDDEIRIFLPTCVTGRILFYGSG
jgi:hypothetical protein